MYSCSGVVKEGEEKEEFPMSAFFVAFFYTEAAVPDNRGGKRELRASMLWPDGAREKSTRRTLHVGSRAHNEKPVFALFLNGAYREATPLGLRADAEESAAVVGNRKRRVSARERPEICARPNVLRER